MHFIVCLEHDIAMSEASTCFPVSPLYLLIYNISVDYFFWCVLIKTLPGGENRPTVAAQFKQINATLAHDELRFSKIPAARVQDDFFFKEFCRLKINPLTSWKKGKRKVLHGKRLTSQLSICREARGEVHNQLARYLFLMNRSVRRVSQTGDRRSRDEAQNFKRNTFVFSYSSGGEPLPSRPQRTFNSQSI